jgi:uncharacterized protein (TIGR03086 family)
MARSELLTAEPARRHGVIADDFARRVHGTRDWSVTTPVSGWAARDVVAHLVEWLPAFIASGSDVRLPTVPSPSDEPAAAWYAHQRAVQAILEDPSTAGAPLTNEHIGAMPLGQAIDRFYTSDVFLHTWDLARATGQEETLDPELCAAMLAEMESVEGLIRRSGQYGPAVPVAPDADAQTRLIGFIGRDPARSAAVHSRASQ